MKFAPVALANAEGLILAHNIIGPQGNKILRKGLRLRAQDIYLLRALDQDPVYAAELEAGDIHEDEAARRVAVAAAGAGVYLSRPAAGRCNLIAALDGLLVVNTEVLRQINSVDGITLATRYRFTVVPARCMVATAKIIPYAVPQADLIFAETVARQSTGVVRVSPLVRRRVGLILSGSEQARERTLAALEPALRRRILNLGSEVLAETYVPLAETAIAQAIETQIEMGAELIVLAGDTAIMDRRDVVPQGIELAGGIVVHFGAPVDPGNLLLVAYRGDVPLLGAPGCARSRHANVVDAVLPRLMAGERLTKADFIDLGHGGLLDDDDERSSPRLEDSG